MHVAKNFDVEKLVPVGDGIPLGGKTVYRQRGMIYWYRWGEHTFDIRVMRKILGLPESLDADYWFKDNSAYTGQPERAFQEIVEQLRSAMDGCSFELLMAAHDTACDREDATRREADRVRPQLAPDAMSIPTTRPIYHNNKLSIIRPGLTFEAIDMAVASAARLVTQLRAERDRLASTQGKRGNIAAMRAHRRAAKELMRVEVILDQITTDGELPF